ncbi:hypothetical protein M9H77_12812 [Catharanthus roseus]|uniref:Uncharacterized protein n=1 Tax=Catharanthus roseus TaxID=4058 RepID=A0ACC0BIM2_CATRO|nr:hypothetical protein M9H77_12812 [Catharanthus roseus]
MDDQLKLIEEFSRCQVAPWNIMASLLEKNPDCAVRVKLEIGKIEDKWQRMQWFLGYLFTEWLNPCALKFVKVWTDSFFLKIDSLIGGHITEIKTTVEYSRLKEKHNDKNNPIVAQLCYNVSHLALRIIKEETKRAPKILADPENLCVHWVRTSQMLPCSTSLLRRYQRHIPLKLEDVHIFWRLLEINGLSGIEGQQYHEESDLQKQLLDFTVYNAASSYKEYLTSCYPVKYRRSGFWGSTHIHLILATNTYNLCIVLIAKQDSCTVFPFYSSSEQVGDTVVIRHLVDSKHFIVLHMKNNSLAPTI